MPVQLVAANITVLAHQFNPTIFSQAWLVRKNIATEQEFLKGCLFSDMMVNVIAPQLSFLVSPEQLILAPRFDVGLTAEQEATLVEQKIQLIVRALPETPYRAAGLNFTWN